MPGQPQQSTRTSSARQALELGTTMMFIAGRRCRDFVDSSLVRTYAQSYAGIGSSRARVPYTAGCESSSATGLRLHAQAKYSKRCRAAYAPIRSRADAPHRASSTKSRPPPTDRRRDAELQITDTTVAGSRRAVSRDPSLVRTRADTVGKHFVYTSEVQNRHW